MKNSEYFFSLYNRHVKIKQFDVRIQRDIKHHNWLLKKYKHKKSSSSESKIRLNEIELNRRIKKDLINHNWLIQKYADRDKLESQPQNDSTMVQNM